MNQLKLLLVDDEPHAIELLRRYADRLPFVQTIASTRDPLQAAALLQEYPVDVLFLDINMPVMSGMELFRNLDAAPLVVFTTAYPEYAVEAFAVQALDYLVKPIAFPRFMQACLRAARACRVATGAFGHEPAPEPALNLVFVKSGATLHKLNWEEILYLEKDENYVLYHTASQRVLSRQTLADAADLAPAYFVRIHKSYVVSLRQARKIEREQITLTNGLQLPVGESFRAGLAEKTTISHVENSHKNRFQG